MPQPAITRHRKDGVNLRYMEHSFPAVAADVTLSAECSQWVLQLSLTCLVQLSELSIFGRACFHGLPVHLFRARVEVIAPAFRVLSFPVLAIERRDSQILD